MNEKTKKLVLSALMAAITCVATMVIKIPTPTMGYIHPGDAAVLLSGFLLGPIAGGLAAGIGSMFSDLFSGYPSYAPATFVIKALTAMTAALLMRLFLQAEAKKGNASKNNAKTSILSTVTGGIVGEAVMVLGYFVYEIFLMALSTGDGFSSASLAAGVASSAAGVPFNIIQGLFGIIVAAILYPILKKSYKE